MRYVCDCGLSYTNLGAVEACQINNHGQPRKETPGLLSICRELERLAQEIESALGVSVCEGQSQVRLVEEFQALIKINREAVKIYERGR